MNDIMPFIRELYYTPLLDSIIENRNFFIIVKYPTITLKFNVGYPRWWGSYDASDVYGVIDALSENIHEQLHLSNFTIIVYQEDIRFIGVDNTIMIKNTNVFRQQLINILTNYIDFVSILDF
jgi:hypothetical protein